MRQVDACDFCGGDAVGLYEPLPASLPDSPRLLLCASCRDRLAAVVDPLLARLGEGEGSLADAPAPDSATPTDPEATPAPSDDAPPARDPRPDRPPDGGAGADEAAGDAAVGESRDASGRPQRDRGGTPHGYRKVMRFLENRELPVDREAAETLAGEAYDLETDDVARAIDHAVQYGRLREVDGQLKR